MRRRDFLKGVVPLGVTPLVLNGLPMRALASSLLTNVTCSEVNERVLVVIQLNGGNDGLNTVIPIDQYSHYANWRPTLAVPATGPRRYLDLNATTGLHPDMGALKTMYDNGMVNIIQNVGYDETNRSHFKGTDLWFTGGDSTPTNQNLSSGWMGRYLNSRFPNYPTAYPNAQMPDPPALEFGALSISLGFYRQQGAPIAMAIGNNPTDFYNMISNVGGALPTALSGLSHWEEQMQYIMDLQRSSNSFANRINQSFNQGSNAAGVTYPTSYHTASTLYTYQNDLSPQLQTVARLIKGGLQTKVYLVRLNGFDTHDAQVIGGNSTGGNHAMLLYHLSGAVKAFFDDLQASGHANKVMAVTFSEFGRQVGQNGNLGTDHGTYQPMFVFGPSVLGGIIGSSPNLAPNSGNVVSNYLLNKEYDYRQVFTTLLQDWLGASDTALAETQFYNYRTQKLAFINPNDVVPPACYAAPFPVGLTSFDATVIDNDTRVRLDWITATETNSDYFEVQRSADSIAYESLPQRISAAGNSSSRQNYRSFDDSPMHGVSHYRLKQVDFDGTFHYLDVVSVTIETDSQIRIRMQVAPNPASHTLNVSLTANQASNVRLELMNLAGQLVRREELHLGIGVSQLQMDISGLNAGHYMAYLYETRPGYPMGYQLASKKVQIQ